MKLVNRFSAVSLGVAVVLAAFAPAEAYVLRGGNPGKWGTPLLGTGASVTWSIMGAGLDTDKGLTVDPDSILPSGYVAVIDTAFSAWAAIADLSFMQSLDPGVDWLSASGSAVDIRIGFRSSDGPSGNLGFGYYPLLGNGAGAGDIFIDSDDTWNLGSGPGFSLRRIMVHEIGHAIGLEHSTSGTAMYPFYSAAWDHPQADDIAGAQHLYGARAVVPPSAVVPLPGTLPMFVGAFALFGFVRRKR